jgi:hypothetical protein
VTKQEKAKDARLRREYHVTLEEWNAVLKWQRYKCAICRRSHGKAGQKLTFSTDHCHKTGLVRGLLCWQCNKAIGVFQDSIDSLRNAVLYFEHNPFTSVLGQERFTAPGEIGAKKRKKQLAVFNAARTNNGIEVAGHKTKSKQRRVSRTK